MLIYCANRFQCFFLFSFSNVIYSFLLVRSFRFSIGICNKYRPFEWICIKQNEIEIQKIAVFIVSKNVASQLFIAKFIRFFHHFKFTQFWCSSCTFRVSFYHFYCCYVFFCIFPFFFACRLHTNVYALDIYRTSRIYTRIERSNCFIQHTQREQS